MIDELEIKNRLLVDKLNAQIQEQCAMFKDRTMEALNRGRGGNGGPSEGATSPAMGNKNESAFARSPLQVSRPPNVQSSFFVKQEIERIEHPDE